MAKRISRSHSIGRSTPCWMLPPDLTLSGPMKLRRPSSVRQSKATGLRAD